MERGGGVPTPGGGGEGLKGMPISLAL